MAKRSLLSERPSYICNSQTAQGSVHTILHLTKHVVFPVILLRLLVP